MTSEGFYTPKLDENDDIGTIDWPTLPDLPKIKRPHLKWKKSKVGATNQSINISVVDFKPAVTFRGWNSFVRIWHKFWKIFCCCCYVDEKGMLWRTKISFDLRGTPPVGGARILSKIL